MPTREIDIPARMDAAPLGRFQAGVIALCTLTVLMDGFDVQVIGFVAPAILQAWGVDKSAFGPVFGAGLAGLLVGSLVFGMLADRLGRRPVLIASTAFFGLCMLATASVTSIPQLLALRFLSGLGLGSVMPIALALAGEYSPARRRVTVFMTVSVGFTLGAVLGGLVAAAFIPRWGWPSVFHFGAAVPLALAALMLVALPESLQFLVLARRDPEVARWFRRVFPDEGCVAGSRFIVGEAKPTGAPVKALFAPGRRRTTLLLWAAGVLNLLNLYFLSNWLPLIVKDAGLPVSIAVLAGTTLQLGGSLGALLMGWMIDRFGFRAVLVPCFVVASVAICLIGQPGLALAGLFAVVGVTGFCIVGGQSGLNALAASAYPTRLRSTGIGWALGVGRLGSIVGPVLGGEFMRLGWSTGAIFLAVAVPPALSAACLWAMSRPAPQSGEPAVARAQLSGG